MRGQKKTNLITPQVKTFLSQNFPENSTLSKAGSDLYNPYMYHFTVKRNYLGNNILRNIFISIHISIYTSAQHTIHQFMLFCRQRITNIEPTLNQHFTTNVTMQKFISMLLTFRQCWPNVCQTKKITEPLNYRYQEIGLFLHLFHLHLPDIR